MFFRSIAVAAVLALTARKALGASSAFTYDPADSNGPGHWDDIVMEDARNDCGGFENSPLALEDGPCDEYGAYVLEAGNCKVSDVTFTVNDHGVKIDFPKPGEGCTNPSMEMPGTGGRDGIFDALQFHIHTGSEHTIDGVTFGAEMHVVHQKRDCPEDQERCFAVMGTKLNPARNTNNEVFNTYLDGWIRKHNEQEQACGFQGNAIDWEYTSDDDTIIDPYGFQRTSGNRFFHYAGGLTTPPCSEVVWWNLDDQSGDISPAQYTFMAQVLLDYKVNCESATVAHHGSSSRPTQPQFGRSVLKICPPAGVGN